MNNTFSMDLEKTILLDLHLKQKNKFGTKSKINNFLALKITDLQKTIKIKTFYL